MSSRAGSRFIWFPLTGRLLVVLVLVRVAGLGVAIENALTHPILDEDITRFVQITRTPGTPYRDFEVEYAPGELALIEVIGHASEERLAVAVALISFLADVATAAALAYAWGARAATVYLLLGSGLMGFMYSRIDYVPVAVTAWAIALASRRGREILAGTLLGIAVLIKIWPILLAPVFVIKRRPRALVLTGVVTAAGLVGWLAYGGLNAPSQVVSMRGAPGWQIESTVGVLVWIITGGPIGMVLNAERVGSSTGSEKLALAATALVVVGLAWSFAATERGRDPAGGATLCAITSVLVLSPVFSLQYIAWLLPWAAIAHQDEPDGPSQLMAPIVILSAVMSYFYIYGGSLGAFQVAAASRDAFCVALVAWWFVGALRQDRDDPATSHSRA